MSWRRVFVLVVLFPCLGGGAGGGAGGGVAGQERLQVVRLMAEGVITTTSYLDAGYGALPTLSQVTLCLHFRLAQFSMNSPFLSYYANDNDNELVIGLDGRSKTLILMCCGHNLVRHLAMPSLMPLAWNHMCVALMLETLSLMVVLNDEVVEDILPEQLGHALTIAGGGRLVVGQELDSAEGSFNNLQALAGEVADWVLVNESLSVEEMKEYGACHGLPNSSHPVLHVDASLSGWELRGPSLSYSVAVDDVCGHRLRDSLVMFPFLAEQVKAADLCHKLGAVLPVPQNQRDNEDLTLLAAEYTDKCHNRLSTAAWIGIRGNLTTETWQKSSDHLPVAWSNFDRYTRAYAGFLCASIDAHAKPGTWVATPCEEKACVVCHLANNYFLYLRGLCRETKFDHVFMLKGERGKTPLYIGYYKSRILMRNGTWRLESTMNGSKSFAHMVDDVLTNPLGRHRWMIESDECGQYETELVLSACSPEQFPCSSGQCVPQERRCDKKFDCYDESDEQNCVKISMPGAYRPRAPPPPTFGNALALILSFEITSVRNFDLVGFKIGLEIILRVVWRDSRVEFFNLRDDIYSNRINRWRKPWIPKFFVESSSRSQAEIVENRTPLLLVRREHPPEADDISRVTKEEVFDGANNSLVLERKMFITLNCQFYLTMYPFDNQRCVFLYEVANANSVFLTLNSVAFSGEPQLLEYEVVGASGAANNSKNQASFWVEIKFRNQFGYYVGNAFVPSVFLVTICYLTFWFSLEDFQDRIMVSLTSLLVLMGLLTQTSQSVPKTAYLKFIDVWYIALIFIDFLIIVVLAVIESLRQRGKAGDVTSKEGCNKGTLQNVSFAWLPQTGDDVARKVNAICQVVFPVVCAIFIVTYFALGLSYTGI